MGCLCELNGVFLQLLQDAGVNVFEAIVGKVIHSRQQQTPPGSRPSFQARVPI
jgi:hypothetical protein